MRIQNQRNQAAANNELLERARFALDSSRPDEAQFLAAELLKTNAGNREASKILGYALMMLGRAPEAVSALDKATRGSHDAEAETQLGIALRRCDRTDEAIDAFRRATKRKPPHP